jgi:dTDP-4-dehydrorhamnose reductase
MTAHIIANDTATPGIYHASATGETTWAGFATEALCQLSAREPNVKLATISPILTTEFPTPAARPLNSRMSNDRLFRTFGYRMMHWRDSLPQALAELTQHP